MRVRVSLNGREKGRAAHLCDTAKTDAFARYIYRPMLSYTAFHQGDNKP